VPTTGYARLQAAILKSLTDSYLKVYHAFAVVLNFKIFSHSKQMNALKIIAFLSINILTNSHQKYTEWSKKETSCHFLDHSVYQTKISSSSNVNYRIQTVKQALYKTTTQYTKNGKNVQTVYVNFQATCAQIIMFNNT